MSLRSARPLLVVLGLLVVAAVAVVALRDVDQPAFTLDDAGVVTGDGDGLLGDRRPRERSVRGSGLDEVPVRVVTGPGSLADEFAVVRLCDDGPAVRVRQYASRDRGDQGVGPVRWQGWVAEEGGPGASSRRGSSGGAGRPVGPWRPAGSAGVLVRPGRQVRLATRFDVAAERSGPCRTDALEDGPLWFWRAEDDADGPWQRLRATGPDGTAADVRTGNAGDVRFATAARCGPDATGDTFELDPDAVLP